MRVDGRKGFLTHQGGLSGDAAEEKEEERNGKEQAKGLWRESSPLFSWRNQSLQLTGICETHPLWMLAHCWQGAERYGDAKERRPGGRAWLPDFFWGTQ